MDRRARETVETVETSTPPSWWSDMVQTLPKWDLEQWPWERCEKWLDENGFEHEEGALTADSLCAAKSRDTYPHPADQWKKWVRQDHQKRKDNIQAIAQVNTDTRKSDPRIRFARRGVEHGFALAQTPEQMAEYYRSSVYHGLGKERGDQVIANYVASKPVIAGAKAHGGTTQERQEDAVAWAQRLGYRAEA